MVPTWGLRKVIGERTIRLTIFLSVSINQLVLEWCLLTMTLWVLVTLGMKAFFVPIAKVVTADKGIINAPSALIESKTSYALLE